jgi:hypothetical protein
MRCMAAAPEPPCERRRVRPCCMPSARRVLVALAAVTVLAGCGSTDRTPLPPGPAPPQQAPLDWVERYPPKGPALVFSARKFEVTASGWRAEIALENDTATRWRLQGSPSTGFGVMLFPTNEVSEVESRSREGELPGLREARTFDPPLPSELPPGRSWSGAISAPGRLAAGLFVRIVFGQLVAVGDAPDGMPAEFSWITDNSLALEPSRAD